MLKNFVNYFQDLQESLAHGSEYCTADHNDHVYVLHEGIKTEVSTLSFQYAITMNKFLLMAFLN